MQGRGRGQHLGEARSSPVVSKEFGVGAAAHCLHMRSILGAGLGLKDKLKASSPACIG